jgi:hypothetical protein
LRTVTSPSIEEVLTLCPLSRSTIPGRKACMQWTTPQRFTPTTNSQSAAGVWVKGAET